MAVCNLSPYGTEQSLVVFGESMKSEKEYAKYSLDDSNFNHSICLFISSFLFVIK